MSHLATIWRNVWKPTVVVASAWLIFGSLLSTAMAADSAAPFLANGVKIGEVTRTQAILWARLTKTSAYKIDGVEFTPRARREEGANSDIEKLGPDHGYGNQVPDLGIGWFGGSMDATVTKAIRAAAQDLDRAY